MADGAAARILRLVGAKIQAVSMGATEEISIQVASTAIMVLGTLYLTFGAPKENSLPARGPRRRFAVTRVSAAQLGPPTRAAQLRSA